MSQHPSLSSGKKQKRHRSVLKRYERLKQLKEKETWDDEKGSIFGLPKVKVLKFRVKKEKAAEEAPVEGAVAETPTAATQDKTPKAPPEAQKGKEKEKGASKKEVK